MLGRRTGARSAWCANDDGDARSASEHEMHLESLVDQLIQGQENKVHEHDLCHRAHPKQGSADGRGHNGRFRDRRLANPVRSLNSSQHSMRDTEGASVAADIFANHKDAFIAFFISSHNPWRMASR